MAKKYFFTNKKHSPFAIMSTVLGAIADLSIGYAVYSTYKLGGIATNRLGATGAIILFMATIGLILGYVSKNNPDMFLLFSHIGIILNILAILTVSLILYAGAYGI